jgi:hypothetical protein
MLWDYGDGGSFNNTNPGANGCDTTHGYTNLGMYRVMLTVFPSTNQQVRDIGVRSNTDGQADLTPNFSWSPANPAPGQIVTFNDLTTPANSVGQWQWDFDDATKSYITTPPRASGGTIGHSESRTRAPSSEDPQRSRRVAGPGGELYVLPPNPTNTASCSSRTPRREVESWSWDFRDPSSGGNNTSTLQNPTHVLHNRAVHRDARPSNSNGARTRSCSRCPSERADCPVAAHYSAGGFRWRSRHRRAAGLLGWNFGVGSPNNQSFVQNPPTSSHTRELHGLAHGVEYVGLQLEDTHAGGSDWPPCPWRTSASWRPLSAWLHRPLDGPTDLVGWNFGDPASGAANGSTSQNPTHVFSVPAQR